MSMPDLEIMGYEPEVTRDKRGQVYMATHKGENYLPFMNRSFISFSFGGKNIEDFNLIATTSGDRMKREGSAEFEDLITTYDILDGQFYWGTYFKNNSIQFTLSTDGITQEQLDDFLMWFSGGKIRELILAEHPNRAVMARVSSPPSLSLLPFEHPTSIIIAGKTYNTSTTLYKGDIEITFTMDEPFWYSVVNIFGFKGTDGIYHDEWVDANGNTINVLDEKFNKDVIKIVLEDGIPISSMISASMILGNNIYANLDDDYDGRIAQNTVYITFTRDEEVIQIYLGLGDFIRRELYSFFLPDDQLPLDNIRMYIANLSRATSSISSSYEIIVDENLTTDVVYQAISGALTATGEDSYSFEDADTTEQCIIADNDSGYGAHIDGPHMDESTGIPLLERGDCGYFYYCGTAPSPMELTFTLTPAMAQYFICIPCNSYATTIANKPYNTITIESITKSTLDFTTPGIYTSYNKVINLFATIDGTDGWPKIREAIRTEIHHSAVRAWAMIVIDFLDNGVSNTVSSMQLLNAQQYMQYMFRTKDANESYLPGTYIFNSKTGKATAIIQYRKPDIALPQNENAWLEYGQIVNSDSFNLVEEEVGDMLKSNYLIIRDRNYPDKENGSIDQWSASRPSASHRIYHDVENGLENVIIKYKNLYL